MKELNELSKEELLELIADSGLDVKTLAKNAKLFKTNGAVEKEKKEKKKAEITWEVALDDCNDWAVKRISGRKWKMLVCMTSQGTFFFQDSDGQMTNADTKGVNTFFRGLDHQLIFPNSWVKMIADINIQKAERLVNFMSNENLMKMAKYNCAPTWESKYPSDVDSQQQAYLEAWVLVPNLMKKYCNNQKQLYFIVSAAATLVDAKERWGLDNVYDLIDEYDKSLINLPYCYVANSLIDIVRNRYCVELNEGLRKSGLPAINMEYKAFKDYFLYDSYRMGYARSLRSFLNTWKDTLDMQQNVYQKIKCKYPKALQCEHDYLSYQQIIMSQMIDETTWEEQVEKAKEYEAEVDDYVFIAPTSKEDFLDEASQQQNCLASYIKKFNNGEDIIIFMRRKNYPDVSYVTIEVVDDSIRQRYGYRNRPTTAEENIVIDKWLKKVKDNISSKHGLEVLTPEGNIAENVQRA